MPNPNQDLFDAQVKRRIALERYSDGQSRRTLRFIKEVRGDLAAKIARLQADGRSQLTIRQQQRLLADFKKLHTEIYAKLQAELNSDWDGLARAQAAFEGDALRAADLGVKVSQVTAKSAYTVASARPMQGRLLKDWMKDLEPTHRKRLTSALRISFIEGESLSATLRRVREATGKNGRGLTALVRTANTHIAAAVTAETYKQNADIVEEYEWRAVLDIGTTLICASRDGRRWPVGSGPMPPAHISCRSTTTPVLKGFPPADRETYPEWLKRQDAETQNDILGPSRARLYRKGTYTVDSFVDKKGKTLTLDELAGRKKKPAAKPKPKAKSKLPIAERVALEEKAARKYVLKEGRASNIEHLVAIDTVSGDVIGKAMGTSNSVGFTPAMEAAYNSGKTRLRIVHNHPSSTSLSPQDLIMTQLPRMDGVWAHGHNGSDYYAKGVAVTKAKITNAGRTVRDVLQEMVNAQLIKPQEAGLIHGHARNLLLAKRGHMEYTATLRGSSLSAWEKAEYILAERLKLK